MTDALACGCTIYWGKQVRKEMVWKITLLKDRTNTAPTQEWTWEGPESRRLEGAQQLASCKKCLHRPHLTGIKRGLQRLYPLTLGFVVNKRQIQGWNTVPFILNPIFFLKEKEKRKEVQ